MVKKIYLAMFVSFVNGTARTFVCIFETKGNSMAPD